MKHARSTLAAISMAGPVWLSTPFSSSGMRNVPSSVSPRRAGTPTRMSLHIVRFCKAVITSTRFWSRLFFFFVLLRQRLLAARRPHYLLLADVRS